MENRKTFKSIFIFLFIYMLLSWIIVAGNFSNGEYAQTGYNQFGLFDFILAPLQVFNYFVVTMTKSIDGLVNQVSYVNIILAFASIGIFYGIINKTGVYLTLINDIKKKTENKKVLLLLIVSIIYYLLSSLFGINLILFMFLPFISAILFKHKFNKLTVFTTTIGSMLIGQICSLYNPNINGLNRVLFGISLNSNILTRVILLIMILIILFAFIYLEKNKYEKKQQEILLISDEKQTGKSYLPIIIVVSAVTIILFICMYNWYYMFNKTGITASYDTIVSSKIGEYYFMNNIFGMSEPFGYWTGFTMSALLLLSSLIIKFIYNIRFDKYLDGMKYGIVSMLPTLFYGIISLTLIIVSLHNSNSFIYSIINNIFSTTNDSQIIGLFLSSFLHNFFINDYFALLSSLSNPIVSLYGIENVDLSLLVTQLSHGIVSLITPFNVYLIAGLSYFKIPYMKWLKHIIGILVIITVVSLIVLKIVSIN